MHRNASQNVNTKLTNVNTKLMNAKTKLIGSLVPLASSLALRGDKQNYQIWQLMPAELDHKQGSVDCS